MVLLQVSDVLPWEHITDEQLEQAKQDFVGDIFQTPPMYSAIKVRFLLLMHDGFLSRRCCLRVVTDTNAVFRLDSQWGTLFLRFV